MSIPALGFSTPFGIRKLVRAILTRLNLPHSSSRDPVLLLLASVICFSYLQCSRDFFSSSPSGSQDGSHSAGCPLKPRGVGGCEQSEITALHQAISPFILFTSIGNEKQDKKRGERGGREKWGMRRRGGESNKGQEKGTEGRGEGTEWCYLYEANE